MLEIIERYWGIILAVLGGIFFVRNSITTTSVKLAQMENDLAELKARVKALEGHRIADQVNLAEIGAAVTNIQKMIQELRTDWRAHENR